MMVVEVCKELDKFMDVGPNETEKTGSRATCATQKCRVAQAES